MRKIHKGDLLVPLTKSSMENWGLGVVSEAMKLDFPVAHSVYWFRHKRDIVIEESAITEHFDVTHCNEVVLEI